MTKAEHTVQLGTPTLGVVFANGACMRPFMQDWNQLWCAVRPFSSEQFWGWFGGRGTPPHHSADNFKVMLFHPGMIDTTLRCVIEKPLPPSEIWKPLDVSG